MLSEQWLDPKVLAPAMGVVVASVIVPLLLHWLKGRRERSDKLLELRTKVYTEYFRKYEQAAILVANDYENFSKVTLKNAFRELLEADNSPSAIIAFQEAVNAFPEQVMAAHRKATEEITTLKIVGSTKLLALTNEFEALSEEMLTASTAWIKELSVLPDDAVEDRPAAREIAEKAATLKQLKASIILQMREEIGFGA